MTPRQRQDVGHQPADPQRTNDSHEGDAPPKGIQGRRRFGAEDPDPASPPTPAPPRTEQAATEPLVQYSPDRPFGTPGQWKIRPHDTTTPPQDGRPGDTTPQGGSTGSVQPADPRTPLPTRHFVPGWSIGTREQFDRRQHAAQEEHGRESPEAGHPSPPRNGGTPPQQNHPAPQNHRTQPKSSQDAEDGGRTSSPYQRLDERRGTGDQDSTRGMKQTDHAHRSEGSAAPPRTNFQAQVTDSADSFARKTQDHPKPSTDSGSGQRP